MDASAVSKTVARLGVRVFFAGANVACGGLLKPLVEEIVGTTIGGKMSDAVAKAAGDFAASLFDRRIEVWGPRRAQNEQAQRVIAYAIQRCLDEAQAELDNTHGYEHKSLTIAGKTIAANPVALAQCQAGGAMDTAALTSLIGAEGRKWTGASPLDEAEWESLLTELGSIVKFTLDNDSRGVASKFLVKQFSGALEATLVDLGAKNDPAWFGIVLRFFGEIQAQGKENAEALTDLRIALDAHANDVKSAIQSLQLGAVRDSATPETRLQMEFIRDQLSSLSRDLPVLRESAELVKALLPEIAADAAGAHREAKRAAEIGEVTAKDVKEVKVDVQRIAEVLVTATSPVKPAPPPFLVPSLSQTFVPRRTVLDKIHKALEGNERGGVLRQAVARAFGGYGKTVAAILYAHENRAHYPGGCIFLSMEGSDLTASLGTLTQALGLRDFGSADENARSVKRSLESGEAKLLILDNIVDRAHWERLLGTGLVPRHNCRILLTTRDVNVSVGADIPVGRLDRIEAREIFLRFCQLEPPRDPPTDDIADAIAECLGGLAVAISAVAAYMRLKPHLTWQHYWHGDRNRVKGLKNLSVNDLPDVRDDVRGQLGLDGQSLQEHRRTLRVLDDALDALSVAERRAVEYAALLPEDMAPAEWLTKLLEADASGAGSGIRIVLPDDPGDPDTPARQVLRELDKLDLLLSKDDHLLSLHRLWRTRVNERSATAPRWLRPVRKLRRRLGRKRADLDLADVRQLWDAIVKHVNTRLDVVIGLTPKRTRKSIDDPAALTTPGVRWELDPLTSTVRAIAQEGFVEEAVEFACWLFSSLYLMGRIGDARYLLESVLLDERKVRASVVKHAYATLLSNLAMTLKESGDLTAARSRMEQVIALIESGIDMQSQWLATSHSNMAMILQELGDLREAKLRFEQAIDIHEKYCDVKSIGFATLCSNLAQLLQDLDDLRGARKWIERAIAIGRDVLDPNHPSLAIFYSNCAAIVLDQGSPENAKAWIQEAIEIDEANFGKEHRTLATRFSILALVLKKQRRLTEAREWIERALLIDKREFDENHPRLACDLSNLATILHDQKELPKAKATMELALAIDEKNYHKDHWILANDYSNLALVLIDMLVLAEARAKMVRAIAIQEKNLGRNHLVLAKSFSILANVDRADGKQESACANFKNALDILLRQFDESHPRVVAVRKSLRETEGTEQAALT